jgi:hypothetical protein
MSAERSRPERSLAAKSQETCRTASDRRLRGSRWAGQIQQSTSSISFPCRADAMSSRQILIAPCRRASANRAAAARVWCCRWSCNRDSPDGVRLRARQCSSTDCSSTGGPAGGTDEAGTKGAWPLRGPSRSAPTNSTDLRRTAPPSALAAPRSARVRPPRRAALAGGRSDAGSRRRALAAPPPRRAGRPRTARAARSGRRS